MKYKTIPLFIAILMTGCGITPSLSSEDSLPSETSTSQIPTSISQEEPSTSQDELSTSEESSTSFEESGRVDFNVYAINDLHGAIIDKNGNAGIAKTSTYLKAAREDNPNTLIISSGDMWQGSSESNNTKGLLVTDWMNDVGFNAMTLGNHEYDWSDAYITSNQAAAEFPMLAINLFDSNSDQRVSYAQPSVMVDMSGVQVGIIGAIGNVKNSILSTWVEDVDFKTGYELTELVKNESDKLKSEGADIIIYSLHDGFGNGGYTYPAQSSISSLSSFDISSYYDSSLSNGYVDLVFEGHTHQKTIYTDPFGVYHLQAGGYGEALSYVNVTYDFDLKEMSVNEADLVYTADMIDLDEDSYAASLFSKYADMIGDIYSPIGYNATTRYSNYLRQVVADLYIKKGLEVWSENYDIVLGGGYLNTRLPYSLEAGNINVSMVQELFPFENNLELVAIRGGDLLDKFINTSNSNYFTSYSEYGNSIRYSIDRGATYYIIVDQYTTAYGPNNLTLVEEMAPRTYAYQLLVDYIKAGNLA